jgi:hypothetical protein
MAKERCLSTKNNKYILLVRDLLQLLSPNELSYSQYMTKSIEELLYHKLFPLKYEKMKKE